MTYTEQTTIIKISKYIERTVPLFFISGLNVYFRPLILPSLCFISNSLHSYGWSCLHYACAEGHLDIVKTLLDKGSDVYMRDQV